MSLLAGASIASFVYLGLSPRLNNPLYRYLLFYPTPFPDDVLAAPTLEGIAGEDVYFQGDMDQRLHGWFWLNPGANRVAIFNHGNAGNITIRDRMCTLLLRSGCSVLVYDYQGFGRSNGKPSVHGICSDGMAALNYVVSERGFTVDQVILYGESLGVSVATYVARRAALNGTSGNGSQPGPAGVILQSGFASLRRIAVEHYPFLGIYPQSLFPQPALDNLSILSSWEHKVPLLFIHGDRDIVIPVKHSIDMYEAAIGPKNILRLSGTGHSDIFETAAERFVEIVGEFIDGRLVGLEPGDARYGAA